VISLQNRFSSPPRAGHTDELARTLRGGGRRRRLVAFTALLAVCAIGVAVPASGATGKRREAAAPSGSATFAMLPGSVPNYIFPMWSPAYASTANAFDFFLYKPLYWPGIGQDPVMNPRLSLAYPPTWSKNSKTVTVKLKKLHWSNGQPLTAENVKLWQNMVTAEKHTWVAAVPGAYPSNVTGTTIVNSRTISFHLTRAYSHRWFWFNELSQITPFPESWDVTSVGAKPGSGGCLKSVSKCAAVYNFLNAQAKKGVGTYASNPLWQTVDGPWKLTSMTTAGQGTFAPNKAYDGVDKPHLSKITLLPFSSDAAEFNVLRAGHSIDIGYLPASDIAQQKLLESQGYTVKPWTNFAITYALLNLHNPQVGPILSQTYIRQALEELVDQKGDIQAFYHGDAAETCGPVPIVPRSTLTSAYEKSCPFSFSVQRAIKTLKAHGWKVIPNGVDTCQHPGTGANQCGAGIAAGAKLEFQYIYATGVQAATQTVENEISDSAKAGIKIEAHGTTPQQAISAAVPCKPKQASCSWQIVGASWDYAPAIYPTGEDLFATGGGFNLGSYSNAQADKLIKATFNPGIDQSTLNAYQNYLTNQIPVIWQPNAPFQIAVVNSKLKGFDYDVFEYLNPSDWSLTK
jgi:peptide/nickel transport system substrate-binding protein